MKTGKKIILLLVLILGSFLILGPSCYNDKEDALYPFQKCDTTHVTYSQIVSYILITNCLSCHSSANPQGNVTLDSWAAVKVYVTNGKLIPSIDHTGPYPMPKGGSMLPCSIAQIQQWVSDGAQNN
jgi:mono/diheme cytochrome c family protein